MKKALINSLKIAVDVLENEDTRNSKIEMCDQINYERNILNIINDIFRELTEAGFEEIIVLNNKLKNSPNAEKIIQTSIQKIEADTDQKIKDILKNSGNLFINLVEELNENVSELYITNNQLTKEILRIQQKIKNKGVLDSMLKNIEKTTKSKGKNSL